MPTIEEELGNLGKAYPSLLKGNWDDRIATNYLLAAIANELRLLNKTLDHFAEHGFLARVNP